MSSDGQELDSQSFNKNYTVLKETADWLSQQGEPDIDELVPRVEKAMKAYQICKDRLSKVQATLGQYLQNDASTSARGAPADRPGRSPRLGTPSPGGQGEVDSPF